MRRFSQRHGLSTLSELNVTPLLDLAFVLLIIFMITTPLMEKSVDLVVPSSKAAKDAVDPAAVQTITIDRNAVVQLNKTEVSVEELTNQLRAIRPENAAVVIRTHKELPVQKLVDVMDAVKKAEITRIGVVTSAETP